MFELSLKINMSYIYGMQLLEFEERAKYTDNTVNGKGLWRLTLWNVWYDRWWPLTNTTVEEQLSRRSTVQ